MKVTLKTLCMTLPLAGLMTSCLSEEHEFGLPNQGEGQGTLTLNLSADATFNNTTRALNENDYKITNNYNVQIINATNNNSILECKASELGSHLPLTLGIGSYKIMASYGKQHDASRSEFQMVGQTTVTLKAKEEKDVAVSCTPTCGKISVAFDAEMAVYYEDFNVTFGGTQALGAKTISWAKTDSEPWYVALSENGETINYTINLKARNEYLHQDDSGNTSTDGTVTGTFQLQRNKAQKLTIKPNYTPTTEGGLKLTITIDESTNDHEITYDVPVTWI